MGKRSRADITLNNQNNKNNNNNTTLLSLGIIIKKEKEKDFFCFCGLGDSLPAESTTQHAYILLLYRRRENTRGYKEKNRLKKQINEII